jgi:LPXTG-site transpeptidase (sortase) family protein
MSIPEFHPTNRSRAIWTEVLKFFGLFLFFFTTLALIVMGPTIYTSLSYLLFGASDSSNKYDLPSQVGDNPADLDNLSAFVADKNDNIPSVDTILIPKINVEAPLVYIQNDTNASILNAIKDGVGHYPGTAMPGRIGNSFFTAHSSYYWWNDGKYNQIFALLHNLEAGDLVYIYYQGGKFVYKVKDKITVSPSDVHVLDQTASPTLSLMTCTPIGTNLKRLIVRADLVSSPAVSGSDFDGIINLPQLPRILPLY